MQKLINRTKPIETLMAQKTTAKNEGPLKATAQKLLEEARKTPDSEYISHEDLKKRLLR
ncbi:hypothetical protein J4219_00635 [Candidatus Woesearchaeota archaeon]|nr:hypothetical protein [Candidatus Woesearchaeota archaeon]